MENNKLFFKENREYKFFTQKIEKYLSFGALILLFLSFQSSLLSLIFFIFTGLVLVYYFVWFRKSPPYVILAGNRLTVHNSFFFKPSVVDTEKITHAGKGDKGLLIKYNDGGADKALMIYSYLLSPKDSDEIYGLLSAGQ